MLRRIRRNGQYAMVRLRARSRRFWLVAGLSLFLGSYAILIAFDVIPVGEGVLDDRVPAFVYVMLGVTFWSGVLILSALAVGLARRRFRRP